MSTSSPFLLIIPRFSSFPLLTTTYNQDEISSLCLPIAYLLTVTSVKETLSKTFSAQKSLKKRPTYHEYPSVLHLSINPCICSSFDVAILSWMQIKKVIWKNQQGCFSDKQPPYALKDLSPPLISHQQHHCSRYTISPQSQTHDLQQRTTPSYMHDE